MVKDTKTGTYFRIDKVIEAWVDKKLTKMKKKKSKNFEKMEQELLTLKVNIESMTEDEVWEVMLKYKIKAPETGNPLSEPKPFNLMFQTQIGPGG
jgi:glycyl-tRNA synthetase